MEIWIDTVSPESIRHAELCGLLHGVTTNPTLISKHNAPLEVLIETLLGCQTGPLAVQVVGNNAAEMVSQARALSAISPRIYVKIPVTESGLQAMHQLRGMPIMATAVVEPMQAFTAAHAGASYIAFYLSQMGETALDKVGQMQKMMTTFFPAVKLLGASIRLPTQLIECATRGVAACTIKEPLLAECLETPPRALDQLSLFDEAWQKALPSALFPNKP